MVELSFEEQSRSVDLRVGFGRRARVFAICLGPLLLVACGGNADELGSTRLEETANTTRVCSWNIRRLGHKFDGVDKDMPETASIINDNCDVVAIQEVMQTHNETVGYNLLLTTLGEAWGGVITARPRPDTSAANAERYAFLFRKTAASSCTDWQAGAEFISDEQDAFLREPAWTCLKLAGRTRDLLLVTYHAIFGSLAERRREVGLLDDDLNDDGQRDDIVRTIRGSRPNADVIIVGDFNLKPNDIATLLPAYKDLVRGAGSTINDNDEITDNQYDHALLAPGEPLLSEVTGGEILDVRSVAHTDKYFRSVSDHLPIRFLLPRTEPVPPPPAPDPTPGPGPTPTVPPTPPPAPPAPSGYAPSSP